MADWWQEDEEAAVAQDEADPGADQDAGADAGAGAGAGADRGAQPLRLLVWTWNTESVRFGETPDTARPETTLDWESGFPVPLLSCEAPRFVESMAARVAAEQPDLVVIGVQEDAKPGSYWLSAALPPLLHGYRLLEKTRLIGLGLTTLTKATARGLRLAVFVREAYAHADAIRCTTQELLCGGLAAWTRGKGGASIVLDIPRVGRLALVNCHLPFDSASLGSWRARADALQAQADHLEQLHAGLVLGTGQPLPDHVVLLGDLNFRIDAFQSDEPNAIGPQGLVDRILGELAERGCAQVYAQRDELRQVLLNSHWLRGYREGCADRGPDFAPTCKLRKSRPPQVPPAQLTLDWLKQTLQVQASEGRRGPRTPGWADRILFRSYAQGRHGLLAHDAGALRCLAYERWDLSALSDHAAVMALLELAQDTAAL
jgi:hypothetical protein